MPENINPENIKFEDYLREQLKDPEFKKFFDKESVKLDEDVRSRLKSKLFNEDD